MEKLKTICLDKYGMETTEELKPFISEYNDKIREIAKEFVGDCIAKNIEHDSAYGMLLSMVMGELSLAYSKKCIQDMRN